MKRRPRRACSMPAAPRFAARRSPICTRSEHRPSDFRLCCSLQDASITNVLGQYPGLTFARLVKPRYANPASIPVLVKVENELNAGSLGSPTIPMFIGQGANGLLEGTPGNKPGIGRGDGVMVAGDVPHPGSRLLRLRHDGGLHPVRRAEPRHDLPRLDARRTGLARQSFRRKPGTERLLADPARQLPGSRETCRRPVPGQPAA